MRVPKITTNNRNRTNSVRGRRPTTSLQMRRHSPYARFKKLTDFKTSSRSTGKLTKRDKRLVNGHENLNHDNQDVSVPLVRSLNLCGGLDGNDQSMSSESNKRKLKTDDEVVFNDGLDKLSYFKAPFEVSYYDDVLRQYEAQFTDTSSDSDTDGLNNKPFYYIEDDDVKKLNQIDEPSGPTKIDISPVKSTSNSDHFEVDEHNDGFLATCQNCRFYQLNAKGTFIIILEYPSIIPILGIANIKSLWGRAKINGYCLESDAENFVPLCSINSMGQLMIKTFVPSDPDSHRNVDDQRRKIRERLLKYSSNLKIIDEILKSFSPCKTMALLIQKLSLPIYSYFRRTHRNLFEKPKNSSCIVGTSVTINCGFSLELRSSNGIRWDSTREDILNDLLASLKNDVNVSPRIVVCGGSNVGKSTFCRHLVNSLLNKCNNKVSWFDCDPGQSEFTPPGVISIVEVTCPLLGPSFTHQIKPKQMYFVGGTSVADSPWHYVTCVEKLFKFWTLDPDLSKQPLIINTMGWRKGLGVMLLADIVRLIRPTHVIQIDIQAFRGRNMPNITSQFITKNNGLSSLMTSKNGLRGRRDQSDMVDLDYKFYNIESLVNIQIDTPKAYFKRDLAMVAYFSQLHHKGEFVPLNECSCFSVPMCSIALHVCNQIVSESEILYAFNGNVVALCECKPKEMISTLDPTFPKFLKETPVGECFGYGIVRAISMEDKYLYVITPVAPRLLNRVNALLIGSGINVPVGLLKRQTILTHLPYVTIHKRTVPFAITNRHVKPRTFKKRYNKR